jgi:hypothetical protein
MFATLREEIALTATPMMDEMKEMAEAAAVLIEETIIMSATHY